MALHTLCEATQVSFTELPDFKEVHKAVANQRWEIPIPIQAVVMPALLRGKHVGSLAQTSSGQTAAFAMPLIETIDPF